MATALRGNIHWHDFGPITGAELSGNRPALIISNNFLNKSLTTAITAPTSKTEPQERFRRQHIWLNESESYASARQLKSVLQENLGEYLGRASSQEMEDVIASITGRICRGQTPGLLETPQGLRPIQRGTVLQHLAQAQRQEAANGLLVLDYNAGNHMAVVVDLEYRARNADSPVAVPVRINGEALPASALVHRISSLDLSQREFTPIATADSEDTEQAIGRLIQMIEG
ncbi:MAG: type II toxin-antitoxin system PemK/MazF family toxin [Chloroflexi bacterium]|nr:type II toxin-antitoxin system PemK/MazF family toxin [Chloroflexota bacterium]MYE39255.1 type II toxin-antitoxin system PemK/MazF family toxin [Chloroflexota bacterium]